MRIVAHGTSEKVSEGATSGGDHTSVSVLKVGGYDSSASDCPSGADPVLPRTPILANSAINFRCDLPQPESGDDDEDSPPYVQDLGGAVYVLCLKLELTSPSHGCTDALAH